MDAQVCDYTGQRYGRRTILGPPFQRGSSLYVSCRCDCGKVDDVHFSSLRLGKANQCRECRVRSHKEVMQCSGCQKGLSRIFRAEHRTWYLMNLRCSNPEAKRADHYWLQFIRVVPRWHKSNPNGFRNFLKDMGPRPDGHQLSRYPFDDYGYGPWGYWGEGTGCRWDTPAENVAQRKGTHLYALPDGRVVSESAAAKYLGVRHNALLQMRVRGKSSQEIIQHYLSRKDSKI